MPAQPRHEPAPAFQPFFAAQGPAVLRLLVGMLGPVDAEDAFQETFLKVLRSWPPRLEDPTRLDAWVLTVAHRTALDALRRGSKRERPGGVLEVATHDLRGIAALDATQLWAAVRDLPPRQRASLVLRVVLDQSFAQVAEVLGCTPEAARRSHADALGSLRRQVETGRLEVER